MERLAVGDVVISLKGRDKDEFYLVVETEGDTIYIANGKQRKISSAKKKNVKHLRKVKGVSLLELAEQIKKGTPIGNDRLSRAIKVATKIIRED